MPAPSGQGVGNGGRRPAAGVFTPPLPIDDSVVPARGNGALNVSASGPSRGGPISGGGAAIRPGDFTPPTAGPEAQPARGPAGGGSVFGSGLSSYGSPAGGATSSGPVRPGSGQPARPSGGVGEVRPGWSHAATGI